MCFDLTRLGYLYMQVVRAVVADRNEAMTGIKNTLILGETRFATERSLLLDKDHQVLLQKLQRQRDAVRPLNRDVTEDSLPYSLKGLLGKLRSTVTRLKSQDT